MERNGSFIRTFLAFFLATIAAFYVLLKLDLPGRLAYSIEKSRIKAMRETLPAQDELDEHSRASRTVAQVVSPAVVSITTERRVTLRDDESMSNLFRRWHRFLERDADTNSIAEDNLKSDSDPESDDAPEAPSSQPSEPEEITVRAGVGSGFIFDADRGLILTNRHVIAESDAIKVHLADGQEYEARLIGEDPRTDLAVIAIDANNLIDLPIGDSELMQVGDDVFAVGNPFGLGGSFSRGIVSATGRSNINIHGIEYRKFIQTDAVINPGNSGGPLVNMRGEVVGVNTAIATNTGSYDGVGFAIPSTRVRQLLPQLVRGGLIIRGYLGVSITGVKIEPDQALRLGWTEPYGLIVGRVVDGSPAERADLRAGDILLDYEGERLHTTEDLIEAVALTKPGDAAAISVWRDAQRQTITAKIDRQPEGFSTRMRIFPVPPRE